VVVIGDMGKLELLKEFPTVYKGTHVNHPKVSVRKATNVVIESAEPMLVYADGELLGECPVEFGVVPKALSIVV
jgi:diacylglycerol kinase (ATP)